MSKSCMFQLGNLKGKIIGMRVLEKISLIGKILTAIADLLHSMFFNHMISNGGTLLTQMFWYMSCNSCKQVLLITKIFIAKIRCGYSYKQKNGTKTCV